MVKTGDYGQYEPLEAICRAIRDSEPGMENRHWRYWLPSARAALVALSECKLPLEPSNADLFKEVALDLSAGQINEIGS